MHTHERSEDADRHVALRILRFLRRRDHRIEADEGEEDDACRAKDAAPAECVTPKWPVFGRNERVPVRRVDVHAADTITRKMMATLMNTMRLLNHADSLVPLTRSTVIRSDEHHRGNVQ